jgi:diguanylate cyclase (GGDEF)-like protein
MDVLAGERKDFLLSPALAFRNTVPPALGVTLLAAVWIAIVLVRRRMQPLDDLVVATDRLSRGDFSSPVRVESDDEFAGVGRAFNAMQGMLGRQFAELAALSKVDRLILDAGSLNAVMEAAAREIAALQPDGVAAMVMVDQDSPSRSVVFWTAGTDVRVFRGAIDQRAIVQLDDLHGSGSADSPAAVLIGLGLDQLFPARVQLVAVRDGEEVVGVIAISDPDDPDLRSHQQCLARQFADRLSVAAATIRQRARLYALGHIDDLTGLPNRQLFKERLGQALNHSLASGVPGHLLYIDLDRFKQVNDAEGHAMGDRLLCAAAERIVSCVRLTDTVARLAGDEFTVLLADPVDPAEVTAIAERIVADLQRPFRLEAMEYFISASIGVASFPGDGETLVQVIRNADLAMYAAKDAGGGRIVRYDPVMQASVHDRVEAEAALRHAVDHGEFCVFYQPQIEAASGRVSGVEALIRWQRPGIGLMGPDSFIPLAESTGLIRELGEFALETACRDFVAWRAAGLELDRVSVNVSLRELKDPAFETHLAEVLDRTGLPRGCLELEVTESVMAEDIVRASARLWSIQARGVCIAIDDFGTGYSSLAYLRGFPVDTLKIDRTFVQDIPASASAASLLESIVEMARRLGKNTVAEGVETIEQARFLEKCRCSHLQGYLFARPMPEADFFNYALAKNSLPRRERRLAG